MIIISIIIHTIVINSKYRVVFAIRIRTHVIIFLTHRIRHKPPRKDRAVLPRAEVGIADAEVRSLVLLAREPVAQGDCRAGGGQAEVRRGARGGLCTERSKVVDGVESGQRVSRRRSIAVDDSPHAAKVVGDVIAGAGLGEAPAVERGALEGECAAGAAPVGERPAVHQSGAGGVERRDFRPVGEIGVLNLQRGSLRYAFRQVQDIVGCGESRFCIRRHPREGVVGEGNRSTGTHLPRGETVSCIGQGDGAAGAVSRTPGRDVTPGVVGDVLSAGGVVPCREPRGMVVAECLRNDPR